MAFQPVQGAFADERGAARAPCLELAGQGGEHRVMAQLVMIDQVLVAERDADNLLHHQGANLMLDQLRPPTVAEVPGKAFGQPDRPIGRTEQQRTSIRGDRPAVKPGDHDTPRSLSKFKLLRATLCRHQGIPTNRKRSLLQKHFRKFETPMHLPLMRNAG